MLWHDLGVNFYSTIPRLRALIILRAGDLPIARRRLPFH